MRAAIIDSLQSIDSIDKKLDVNEILILFKDVSEHPDSEIKLYKSDIKNYIISLNWKGINQWKIDSPIELNKVHRQRYATTEESIFFIKKIYQYGDLDNEENFIDVPIRHFTLDEMLEFKKEDEMMLRGEDSDDLTTSSSQLSTPTESSNSKNNSDTSLVMGEQLGTKDKKASTSTQSKIKTTSAVDRKPKPSTNNNSFFSI